MHNLGTDGKFPAKISWWLIINVSIRFICLQNYFLDQQHVNLAPQADFHELAAFLPLDQEAGTLDDNMHSACTWFFHHVHLDRNLPNLGRISWISRKTDRKNAWALLLSLLFACSRMILVEGYVHGNANIQLSSPKLWLPKNHREVKLRELSELLEIKFEVILPWRKQHDQRYTQYPIIEETVRKLSGTVNRFWWIRWKQQRNST